MSVQQAIQVLIDNGVYMTAFKNDRENGPKFTCKISDPDTRKDLAEVPLWLNESKNTGNKYLGGKFAAPFKPNSGGGSNSQDDSIPF